MPTYAYICRKCNHKFDRFQKVSDEPIKECEQCSAQAVDRLPSAGIGLHFQGSGFYSTDYNKKPSESVETSPEKPSKSCDKPGGCGCHES